MLGHGWRMWENRHAPRCAPMRMEEWDSLVQNAPRESLTFLDFDLEERPDIHEHIGNDWKRHLTHAETYDIVIDAVTHMSLHERGTSNYWDGVMYALKENGIYIGWDPSQNY